MPFLSLIVAATSCCWSPPEDRSEQSAGKEAVGSVLASLDKWLVGSPHAGDWHEALGTPTLRRELARSGKPDPATLESLLQQLSGDAAEFGAPPVVRLRRNLEEWLALESLPGGRGLAAVAESILKPLPHKVRPGAHLASATTIAPASGEVRRHLIALVALLGSYAEKPTESLAESIDDQLNWLTERGNADSLVSAIRQYFGHPNLWIDVSEKLLDDTVVRTIDRSERVNDVILGTPVTGTARVRAVSDLVVEPNLNRAVLKIVLDGALDVESVGRHGPARIYTRTHTPFRAEKKIVLDGRGLTVLPTVSHAEAHTVDVRVVAAKDGLGARMVRRVGERRWQALRDEAERESSRHAERDVRRAVDREAGDLIERIDHLAVRPILSMTAGSPTNGQLRFSTANRVLRVGAVVGSLGAPPGRPACDDEQLFTVRVHSTLANRWSSPATTSGRAESFSLASVNPAFAGLVAFDAKRGLRETAWQWVRRSVAPSVTLEGVSLRNGRWGTLAPMAIVGEWPGVEWRPGDSKSNLAARAKSPPTGRESTVR